MLRVATWNVNSIKSRKELVFMWLERVPVEILCLQELKTETHNFPFLDFERLGYTGAMCMGKKPTMAWLYALSLGWRMFLKA
jgi:exonuclease III